jgi:integrase
MSAINNSSRLTIGTLTNLAPGAYAYDHDPKSRGLYARRRATGVRWYVQYVTAKGDRRAPKLGDWPALGIDDARAAAREILRRVARGDDPAAERHAARAALTLGEAIDRYMTEHVRDRLAPNSVASYAALLSCHVPPGLRAKRIADVTASDIERALARCPGDATAIKLRAVLRRLWTVAGRWPAAHGGYVVSANVVTDTDAPATARVRKRLATPDEMRRLVPALEELRQQYPDRVALIFCLMVTGARVSELCAARHDQIVTTADGARLVLIEHKTAAKTGSAREIELPAQALAEIARLPVNRTRIFGNVDRYNIRTVWDLACRAAGVTDLTRHDMRRLFASSARTAGHTIDDAGALLGHAQRSQASEAYAHLFGDARAERAQRVADIVSASAGMRPHK